MSYDKFVDRHVGSDSATTDTMLKAIGVGSVEELISQVIPSDIRLAQPINILKEGMTEYEATAHIQALASLNRPCRTFIGAGYYETATPAAIVRNIFENPAWYTSYTPYQAEISQGRLEALLNFQTAVTSLTGMEISNCSLLDEGTAAAEAMSMMLSQRSKAAVKEGRNILLVDENIFPQTLDVLLTRSEPFGIEIVMASALDYEFTGKEFGAIVQYPGADGSVVDYSGFAAKAKESGVLVTAIADIISLVLLTPPGEWGADIVVGSTQRMGIPIYLGGPSAAYLATKEAYKRIMPGRIIGISVDRSGKRALRMALQTREQHIKRDRATSNICTSMALMATMAGMFAVYHGPKGMRRIALHIHSHAVVLAKSLKEMGYALTSDVIFDTIDVEASSEEIRPIALDHQINLYYPYGDRVRLSIDEVTTLEELNTIVEIFAKAKGVEAAAIASVEEVVSLPEELSRKSEILAESVFNSYHSETELMRYIKKLELRDISLANSMISLGSCTMKLNSAASMMPLSLAGFAGVHPFVPAEQAAGYMAMMDELNSDLAAITGFAAVSNQPNSGAAGEYAGLMVIRAYHQSRGQGSRNVILIPASAHGTNPASAAMAGLKIEVVKCDDKGNISVEDFRAKAEASRHSLFGAMITYPSTHGIFETNIRELVSIIHENGGQVYMDGANMNAQVALTNPGYIGADVCHLNLHKTFAMPHGGGGPGVGTIGVAEHLVPFLPNHPVVAVGGESGTTAVASSPWGSAGLLPITYMYIKMLGEEGLRRSTEMAIVNANYMVAAMADEFDVVYQGDTGRVGHEMIVDCRHFRKEYGIEAGDIARRLMDFGYHAPTLSFPVHETLMVEPTESESKEELDRFISALKRIKQECEMIKSGEYDANDNPLKMAPHTAEEIASDEWSHSYSRSEAAYPLEWVKESKFWPFVSKIDNGYGDRNLICNCN